MAIVVERFTEHGTEFTRTYSDANRYVVNADGIAYEEAIDPAIYGRTYTEGDIMDDGEDSYEMAGRILMGVEE